MHRAAAFFLFGCVLSMACKESFSAEDCSPGYEACVCAAGDSCLDGLVCASNLCVMEGASTDVSTDASSGSRSDDGSATSSTESGGDGDGDGDGDEGGPLCGNGTLDADEVCDDGNTLTEFPLGAGVGVTYGPDDCMSDCSMVLADCGNGELDPGEACDDGNDESKDECTTSCTFNDMGVHAACTRSTGNQNSDQSSGTITNCAQQQEGFAVACSLSNDFDFFQLYAAEGDCGLLVLECTENCLLVPPNMGNWDAATDCPEGHIMLEKEESGGPLDPVFRSKACVKACESDRECRWNTRDSYWASNGGAPYGQYRCQTHPLSNGAKICWDGRND